MDKRYRLLHQRRYWSGNSDLMLSNNLRSQGFDGFSAAWDRYVVAPCALIEEQLQSMAGGTTAS